MPKNGIESCTACGEQNDACVLKYTLSFFKKIMQENNGDD
jgi:hypothetical protein